MTTELAFNERSINLVLVKKSYINISELCQAVFNMSNNNSPFVIKRLKNTVEVLAYYMKTINQPLPRMRNTQCIINNIYFATKHIINHLEVINKCCSCTNVLACNFHEEQTLIHFDNLTKLLTEFAYIYNL